MSTVRDDDVEPMEYVLGLLDPPERRAFELALLDDPDLAREVWRAEEMFAPLFEAVRPRKPPARVKRELQRKLFAGTGRAPARGSRYAVSFWRFLASLFGVATVGAAALIAILVMRPETLLPPRTPIVAAIVGAEGQVTLARLRPDGTLVIEPFAVDVPAGRDPELWLVRTGQAPVSLGLLPRQQQGLLALRQLLSQNELREGQLVVTEEPEGGSPSGAPTGPAIAQGNLREI